MGDYRLSWEIFAPFFEVEVRLYQLLLEGVLYFLYFLDALRLERMARRIFVFLSAARLGTRFLFPALELFFFNVRSVDYRLTLD